MQAASVVEQVKHPRRGSRSSADRGAILSRRELGGDCRGHGAEGHFAVKGGGWWFEPYTLGREAAGLLFGLSSSVRFVARQPPNGCTASLAPSCDKPHTSTELHSF
jgi:hypothetical protein